MFCGSVFLVQPWSVGSAKVMSGGATACLATPHQVAPCSCKILFLAQMRPGQVDLETAGTTRVGKLLHTQVGGNAVTK